MEASLCSRAPKRGAQRAGLPRAAALLLFVGLVAAALPAVSGTRDVDADGAAHVSGRVPFPGGPNGTAHGDGSSPLLGRFDSLPSLACDTRGPLVRDKWRGVLIRAAGATTPVCVPHSSRTCHPPLSATVSEMPCVAPEGDGDTCETPRSSVSSVNSTGRAWNMVETLARSTTFPLQDDAALGVMVHEMEVAGMLTLRRNTERGMVARQTGEFDVLAVSRETTAVCLCRHCGVVAAVDLAAGGIYAHNDTHIGVPVVTLEPLGGGQPEIVLDSDDRILSLGRAVLADAAWLTPYLPWQHLAGATVEMKVSPSARPGDSVPVSLKLPLRWRLHGDAAAGTRSPTRWLQAIAYVFCAPPASSFLLDARWLCADLYTEDSGSGRSKASPRLDGLPSTDGSPAWYRGRRVAWSINLDTGSRTNTRQTILSNITVDLLHPNRPCWLTSRLFREINPVSADEVSLAQRIGSATILVPGSLARSQVRKLRSLQGSDTAQVLWKYSHTYDRAVFGAELPADPVTNVELLVAVAVVVPGLAAVVHQLRQARKQWERGSMMLLYTFALGLVPMVDVGILVKREVAGAAWRAGAMRSQHETAPPRDSFFGLLVLSTETLFLIARKGYRPSLLWAVAAGIAATYVAVPVAVFVALWLAPLCLSLWRGRDDGDSSDGAARAQPSTAATDAIVQGVASREGRNLNAPARGDAPSVRLRATANGAAV